MAMMGIITEVLDWLGLGWRVLKLVFYFLVVVVLGLVVVVDEVFHFLWDLTFISMQYFILLGVVILKILLWLTF